MNMFDEASALAGTIKMRGISQSEMARMLGVSQSYIANKLRLLTLSEDMQAGICEAGLTERHARAILRLRGDEQRRRALKTVIEKRLNVRKTEALVDLLYEPMAEKEDRTLTARDKAESFKKNLAESVKLLRSFGVDASMSQSYFGSKLYITVTLDEDLCKV